MTEMRTHKCDVCGKLRSNDTNHWLRIEALRENVGLVAVRWKHAEESLLPSDNLARIDVCGESCALKSFQRWLSTGSLTEANTNA